MKRVIGCVVGATSMLASSEAIAQSSLPAALDDHVSSPSWTQHLEVHGYVDVDYAFNFNQPADGANFVPGTGSSARRANELSLDLAALDLSYKADPVGARLTLNYGTATQVIHAGEPSGTAIGPEVWKSIQQASLSYIVPVGRGLQLEAGIFPCHVGLEVLATKDNWNYTHSWLAEFSPYYSTGVKATYGFTDHFSSQLHVVNGWQIIGENNRLKTLGGQLAYSRERFGVTFNTMAGPELADDDWHWRYLADLILTLKASETLSFALVADLGHQQAPTGASPTWSGVGAYSRITLPSKLAIAARGELFSDPDGGISGAAQVLEEATATLEYQPADALLLRLEGRYDHSTADVFSTSATRPDGTPVPGSEQLLAVLGAVARF